MNKNKNLPLKPCWQLLLLCLFGFILSACAQHNSPLIYPQDNDSNVAKTELDNDQELSVEPKPKTKQAGRIPNPLIPISSTSKPVPKLAAEQKNWSDVWHRIADGYSIPDHDHVRIQEETRGFLRDKHYLNRVSKRAAPYLYHIVEEIDKRGMPQELALLPIVESAYQPFAYSHSRAAGIWQFIPGTARHYGLKINWWYDGRRDVFAATNAALNYLQFLHDEFDDWLLALAAYNAGEGNVYRAIRRNKKRGKATDFWSLPLPRETQRYVPRLLAVAEIIAKPEQHGISLELVPNIPRLAQVDTESQIDLALVEELSGVPIDTIYLLNPGINQWATDPNGPHKIVLPVDKTAQFKFALAQHPESKRVVWQRHKIRKGETLSHIADKYKTRVSVLKQVNNLRGSTIRAGHELMIPVAAKSADRYTQSISQRLARAQNSGSGYRVNYTVRRGDSLWRIARRYNVSVSQVARWNGLSTKGVLKPGRKLVVWPHGKGQSKHSTNNITMHYTVRRGDSLDRISRRFKVSINDLVNWNSLDKDKYLQPGQKLKVHPSAS